MTITKVLKEFIGFIDSGFCVKQNPLAKIRLRTSEESSDIQKFVHMIFDPENKGRSDYWTATSSKLVPGVTTHLLYAYRKQGRPLPTLPDITMFLFNQEHPFSKQLALMKTYPHITPEEFMSNDNVWEKIYGEYITNFEPFNQVLNCDVSSLKNLKQVMQDKNINSVNIFADQNQPFHLLLTHPKVAYIAAEMQNKASNELSGILTTAKAFINP
jgi:type IV secretion system protein VirD4